MVAHDITAMAYDDGDGQIVPGRHKTILVPGAELQSVMDMPHGNATERQAKNAAYKSALVANLNTSGVPITGWSDSALLALMLANDAAESVAAEADDYITQVLSQSYPLEFNP